MGAIALKSAGPVGSTPNNTVPAKFAPLRAAADLAMLAVALLVLPLYLTWAVLTGVRCTVIRIGSTRRRTAQPRFRGCEAPVEVELDDLIDALRHRMRRDGIPVRTRMRRFDNRLVLSLAAKAMFGADATSLSANGRMALAVLGRTLRHVGNRIDVIGYAEAAHGLSVGSGPGWRRSLDRATAVAEGLRAAGYERPVARFGIGSAAHGATSTVTHRWVSFGSRELDVVIRGASRHRRDHAA